MATAARDRLMPSFQRKLGALVLRDREEGGPKSLLVVTGRTVTRSKLTPVNVLVTIRASAELQAPVAARDRKLRKMAAIARDLGMQTLQRESGHWMCA
jgi:hypothetical protein